MIVTSLRLMLIRAETIVHVARQPQLELGRGINDADAIASGYSHFGKDGNRHIRFTVR